MRYMPRRAPIAYDDLRRPYNVVRGIGALGFFLGVVIYSLAMGSPTLVIFLIPTAAIAIDAAYRMRAGTTALPGLLVDTTAIGFAMYLRGPAPTLHAILILALLVTSTLLLTFPRAAVIVLYATLWSASVGALSGMTDLPLLGVVAEAGYETTVDRITSATVIAAIASLLYQAVRVILAAQDRQEEALTRERRAVQLKNEFVSMVSHELRTPLTGIAGFTDTLSESWRSLPQSEVNEFLSIMSHETKHLSNLVEDILVIPRLEAGQLRLDPEDLDLTVEIHGVAAVVFHETDYSVAIPANVVVHADRTRIRQILRNLLENARKYGGDQVLIEGELSAAGLYKVVVSDNGSGVEPRDQERIFQHFEQLSKGDGRLQQGFGLGLPIARKLARAMGGDLWYEDRFPVGAKFCFTVTVSDSDTGNTQTKPTAQVNA